MNFTVSVFNLHLLFPFGCEKLLAALIQASGAFQSERPKLLQFASHSTRTKFKKLFSPPFVVRALPVPGVHSRGKKGEGGLGSPSCSLLS